MMTSNRGYSILVLPILLLSFLVLSGAPPTVGQAAPSLTLRIEEDSTEADAEGFALIVAKLIFSFDRNINRADIESLSLKANGTDISRLATPTANWMSLDRRTLCLSLTLQSIIALKRTDMGTSQFEATVRLKGFASALEARAAYDFLEHKEVASVPKPAETGRDKAPAKTAGTPSKSVASPKPKPGTIVAGPWLPDTPDDAGLWNKRDTPWRKGEILVSGPSLPANLEAITAEAVDYGKLSPEEYRFAVATAMESMRLIYGDMSPAEEQRFQAKWAPVMDFPTPTAVHYFSVLGPLLSQFIDLRSAIVSLGLQFDETWSQAGVAAGFENEDAVAESIARAQRLRDQMSGLKARMEEVVTRIKALGDPPNPFAARHRARKALDQAVEGLPKPAETIEGEYVLVRKEANNRAIPYINTSTDAENFDYRTFGDLRPRSLKYNGHEIIESCVYKDINLEWDPKLHLSVPKLSTKGSFELKYSWAEPPGRIQPGDSMELKTKVELTRETGEWEVSPRVQVRVSWFKKNETNKMEKVLAVYKELFEPGFARVSIDSQTPPHAFVRNFSAAKELPLVCDFPYSYSFLNEAYAGDLYPNMLISVVFSQDYFLECVVHYLYQFDTTGTVFPISVSEGTERRPRTPAPGSAPTPEEAEKRMRQEAAAEHATVIASLESMVAKWKAELEREKNPDRAKDLNQSIFQAVANIQQESDAIATLQTGELVRTRSVFDEVSRLKFLEDFEKNNQKARLWPRAVGQVDQMISLLPPAEAKQAREWADRQLDAKAIASMDTEKLKQVTLAILHKVQGRGLAEEAAAEEQINFYEEIKWGAGIGMMVVAPFAAAQVLVGGGSWLATQAPSLIAAGYGIGTGYIEGGPSAAVVTGLRFYSGIVDTALSFTEGFALPEGGGWSGGAKNAMLTLLLRKGTELAAGQIIQGRVPGSGAPGRKPTWKEVIEDARFQQAKKDGESLVENYRRTNDAFENMVAKTKPAGVSRNEYVQSAADRLAKTPEGASLTQAMSMVESSYTAKMAINAKTISERFKQDYNLVLETFLEKPTIARTQELMKAMHWNDFEMGQIRHSANTRKVGRDKDLAVKEDGWTPRKNGKPMTLQEFQRDLDIALRQAYSEKTGGHSSKAADWKGTTSIDPEAYLDKAVLNITRLREQGIDPLPSLNKDLAIQTSGVNVHKVELALGKGSMEGRAEACRTMAKEIDTKILPFTPKGSPSARYFENLMAALQRGGDNPRQGMAEVYGITGRGLRELAYVLRDRLGHIIQTGNR